MAVLHLETLAGVARGLTRINEDVFDTDDDPVVKEELEKIQNARVDLRMIKIREDIYGILRSAGQLTLALVMPLAISSKGSPVYLTTLH
ncbi:hypothetical protein JOM56_000795 [Amanita muscaria]